MKRNTLSVVRLFLVALSIYFFISSTSGTQIKETKAATASDGFENSNNTFPIPMPEWAPPIDLDYTDNFPVTFNQQTGDEVVLSRSVNVGSNENVMPGGPVILNQEEQFSPENYSPQNFTELEEVSDPDGYPMRVNAKLFVTYPNTAVESVCSGVLIDSKHVLTAGHCVYAFEDPATNFYPCISPATSCWVSSVRVVPAYDNGDTPYGEASSLGVWSWTQWTVNHNYDHDMGFILLDRPVGALTSWHGIAWNSNDTFYTSNTFHNPGYPAANPYDGESMWYWYGSYDTVTTNVLYIERASIPGQSGSGTYYVDNNQRNVHAVQSHNLTSGGDTDAGQVRLTQNKFNDIVGWINGNTPSQIDWVPLDVNASPGTVNAGDQLSSFDFLLHNYSSVSFNGTVNYSIYISSNDTISTGDQLLGTGQTTLSLSSKNSSRITISPPPTIPSNLSGTYWIGLILNVADSNTNNNDTSGWDAAQITVNAACNTPGKPSLVSPPIWSVTNDVTPTFDWNSASNATQYHILVDNNGDWSSPEVDISTGNTAYTVPSALSDGRYYWAVQGRNTSGSCNEYGEWSDVWVLDIETQGSPAPTLYSPSNGSSITDTTPTFNWSTVSDAQQYQLQVDDNSNFASPLIYITQSNSNYTATSSLNGTYYWRVRAQDTVGNWGNWSSIWSFIIIDFEEVFLPFVIR